mmetsp:Transcript_58728/g.132910  ORF Transcript_58728/g.132910 Transcript_58728/m.132910 type:complete len:249 (-) Transcript_58728:681-1427(-)
MAVCTIPVTHRLTLETAAASGSLAMREAVPMAWADAPMATPRVTEFSGLPALGPGALIPSASRRAGPREAPYTPVSRMDATASAGEVPRASAPAMPRALMTLRCESARPRVSGSSALPAAHEVAKREKIAALPAPPRSGCQFSSSTRRASNMRIPSADTAAFMSADTRSPAPPASGPPPFTYPAKASSTGVPVAWAFITRLTAVVAAATTTGCATLVTALGSSVPAAMMAETVVPTAAGLRPTVGDRQ